jgi:hypothetical protein
VTWLKEGDQNTNYFHRKASGRKRKNKISKLRKPDGSMTENEDEFLDIACNFFNELYKEDPNINPSTLLNLIEPNVTDEMNKTLVADFTDEEIGNALFQIGPLKAPGPDGLPARFFQRNWGLLKKEVCEAIKLFFNNGVIPDNFNMTKIVLIPKVDNAIELKEYRPISLCNVIYKVISKCLVNRLRPYLQTLISENQSAFIPGRLISDNALVAFECFHAIHRTNKEEESFCAYKLDLSKAYDRVDWRFLEGALNKWGFDCKWINWIMACVKSVKYTVQINGHLTNEFSPSRGLRQGDPLSPYLFLLVAESLTLIINKARVNGELQDFKICRGSPGISHLMFADDCLLFFKANPGRATVIKSAISIFENGSGQLLSANKCSLLFSESCPEQCQQQVRQILEVTRESFEDKYLGFPTPEGRMKKGKFQPSKDRLSKKMNYWAERFMSMGAKDALIKSVAQAIPNHIMSIFKLPMGFHDDYMKMVRTFWWGEDEKKRKVHWAAWDILTSPKNLGGVGFRDSKLMNQAMLARQCWRLMKYPNSLCARLLKSIYYPRGNFLDTVFKQDASPGWRGIEFGLELFKEGLIWRIGDGKSINIWRDNWIARDYNLKVAAGKTNTRIRRADHLIIQNPSRWNEHLIRKIFYMEDAEWILKQKLPRNTCHDFLAWHYEKTGEFSVKSAYRLAYNLQHGVRWKAGSSASKDNSRNVWKPIWNSNVPSKVKIFGWRAASDNLATKKNKFRRTLELDSTCNICGREEEDSFHATVNCTKARALRWAMRTHWDLPPEHCFYKTGPEWLQQLMANCGEIQRSRILMILWRSWHLRCDVTHGRGEETIARSVAFLLSYDKDLQNLLGSDSANAGNIYSRTPISNSEVDDRGQLVNRNIWKPPTEGNLKINVDAAFSEDTGDAAIGVIARDHLGHISLAASIVIDKCSDAEEAEACAIREGLNLAVEYNLKPNAIESDCANAVATANSHKVVASRCWGIYRDIERLKILSPGCNVTKVVRSCNSVAHELAKLARVSGDSYVWLPPIPGNVLALCVKDLCTNHAMNE